MSSPTQRRQRRHPAFLSPFPTRIPPSDRSPFASAPPRLVAKAAVKTSVKRPVQSPRAPVAAPLLPPVPREPQPNQSRFLNPVPAPLPHEILKPRRGRNSRRRVREAEHFRRYMFLRRQLKPWSDAFKEKNGRTPSLIDVHQADVPGLLDRFVEYLDALEGLRFDVQPLDK